MMTPARSSSCVSEAPVSGTRGWLAESLVEPTGFVATVTSLHRDGRIRARAVRVLAQAPGPLASAALALRAMDHVRQVREEALRALVAGLRGDLVEPALAVLLAGRDRQHTAIVIQAVQTAITASVPLSELVPALMGSGERDVRRWGFDLAHGHRLLTVKQLSAAVRSERDQLLRKSCGRWLVEAAAPAELRVGVWT